jgi:hypothetical protein
VQQWALDALACLLQDTSQQKPKANPFSSVEPEKKQTAVLQDTKAPPAKQVQQVVRMAAKLQASA